MAETMTSFERLVTALQGKVPDRVPVFLPLTMHGAKELGLSLDEYYAKGENLAEGQLRLQRKYRHDGLFLFGYGVAEAMAFGAEPMFFDDGPPNLASMPIRNWDEIAELAVPDPLGCPPLRETIKAIEICAARVKGKVPIVGVAVPPFSMPAMLMGMEGWLELVLFGAPELREKVVGVTTEFCVRWANAQLAAGADAIVLPDAVSSNTIITREQYIAWSLPAVTETVRRMEGPAVLAGVGSTQATADLWPQAGFFGALVTVEDDLAACKRASNGKVGVLGNLNNVAMIDWTPADVEQAVRECLASGAFGGGFVLAPQWEVPYRVPDEVLAGIVDAAERYGRYSDPATGQL